MSSSFFCSSSTLAWFAETFFSAAFRCACSVCSLARSTFRASAWYCFFVTSYCSSANRRCVFFQSRSKSSHTIHTVESSRKMLDAAKTTFRKSTLYACPIPFFSAIGQMLKKYSPILTMYFRLKSHRDSILSGSDIIDTKRNAPT